MWWARPWTVKETVDYSGSSKIVVEPPIRSPTHPPEPVNYFPRFSNIGPSRSRGYGVQNSRNPNRSSRDAPINAPVYERRPSELSASTSSGSERREKPAVVGEEEAIYEGIPRRTFWIVVAIVAIICAAVGGGVGGFFAHKEQQCSASKAQCESNLSSLSSTAVSTVSAAADLASSSSPSSPSSSSQATKTVTTTISASSPVTNCPSRDGQNYTATNGGVYNVSCNTDWIGSDIVSGNTFIFIKTSLDECLDFCDKWNKEYRDTEQKACVGVVFQYASSFGEPWDAGHCFPKTQMEGDGTGSPTCAGAKLVDGYGSTFT